MNNSLVSIIIPTYNRAHLISETLHSIIAQTYTYWECIVVDDGSTDNTEEILKNYIKKDKRFQYHQRPKDKPKGANACRNYGISISNGDFLLVMDSDDLLHDFLSLAQKHNVKLILDETYLDFRTIEDVHTLWSDPAAQDHLIVLYSFSKAYRITGHRVGAVVASPHQITEIDKFLDTVTICPAQTGQFAAQWGLEHLGDWVEQERQQTIQKLAQFRQSFDRLVPYGWKLLGSGAYFAYVEHPFNMTSIAAAQELLQQGHILALPGAFFSPD